MKQVGFTNDEIIWYVNFYGTRGELCECDLSGAYPYMIGDFSAETEEEASAIFQRVCDDIVSKGFRPMDS